MTLRVYTVGMIFATLVSLGSFIAVLYYFNPESDGLLALIFFYLSLFISASGIFTLAGIYARKFLGRAAVFVYFTISFRQGILLSIVLVASLYLQHLGWLNWWTAIIVILSVVLIEILAITKSK